MSNNLKIQCCECLQMAVWHYMPCGNKGFRYFCEDHVSRGCSCNIISFDDNEEEQYKDDQGRLLPCVEYDYDECGYEEKVECFDDLPYNYEYTDELDIYDFLHQNFASND